jgi:tetratricopeptide (TPR) repeat protein
MSTFVGRDAELAALAAYLAEGAEVVAVVGPAGVGKSRLAREAMARLAANEPDRFLAFVPAAGDGTAVRDALAAALSISSGRGRALTEALSQRERPVLLLDGLELQGAEARSLLADLTPATTVLTARAPTGTSEERVIALGPLSVADGARLLTDAARRRHHAFASAAPDPDVLAIARELGGHPLALKLAGARLPILGARALLRQLRSHAPEATDEGLAAALEGLEPHERRALAAATVMRSFDLEDAEAVLKETVAPRAVADVLLALVERSLLASDGRGRFLWLGPLRAIAARGVPAALLAEARARRDAHLAESVERAARAGAAALRAWVLAHRDGLVAVLGDVIASGAVDAARATPALRALAALAFVLPSEVPIESIGALLDPVLEATKRSGADLELLVRALAARGLLRRRAGRDREGTRDLVDALGRMRAIPPSPELRRVEAEVLLELGSALFDAGDAAAAEAHRERALAAAREAGDRHAEGRAIAAEAHALRLRLDLVQSLALWERAAALHADDALARGLDRLGAARAHVDAGRRDAARRAADDAEACAAEVASPHLEAQATLLRGFIALEAGDGAEARVFFGVADERLSALGDARSAARAKLGLGLLAREEGRSAEAYALCAAVRDAKPDAETLLVASAWLAALAADVGRAAAARAELERLRADVPRATLRGVAAALDALAWALRFEPSPPDAAIAALSLWARLAARAPQAPTAAGPAEGALVVGDTGTWFRTPAGERVGLETRRSMALLLDRLATARLAAPGTAVPSAELQAAGWPGERMLAAAGAHRVRVAIATLRKLGLRDLLVTTPAGYLLSPDVPLARAR